MAVDLDEAEEESLFFLLDCGLLGEKQFRYFGGGWAEKEIQLLYCKRI